MAYTVSAVDSFEPDGIYQNASWISTDNTWQNHTFEPGGDIDYIKFNTTAGEKYLLETQNITDIDTTDTVMRLYDTDGTTLLLENDDIIDYIVRTSRIVWNAPSTGTYYIRVIEWGSTDGGQYQVKVAKQGTLEPYLIGMSDMNVTHNQEFTVNAGVRCVGGYCDDVQYILDPEKEEQSSLKVEKDVVDTLIAGEDAQVIVVLKEDPAREQESDIEKIKQQVAQNQQQVLEDMNYAEPDGEEHLPGVKGTITKISRFLGIQSEIELDIELTDKFKTVNGFAGTVSEAGLIKLANDPHVAAVYSDKVLHTTLDASIPYINADDVWLKQYGGNNITGQGQVICVVDSGIDYTHDYLGNCTTEQFTSGNCAKIPGGYDYYNSDNNPIDDQDHGTHVAGIIASTHPTYKGVAPDAKLLALKACSNTGSCSGSKMISSVDWCNANKEAYNITIITMSIGDGGEYGPDGGICPSWMDNSLRTSQNLGLFISVAAGNEGHTSGISYPGCSPYVVGVGAVDEADSIYYNRGELMDIFAPGRVIYSTVLNDGWGTKSGTSMATPHAAGTAALLFQYFKDRYNRTLTGLDVKRQMIHNAPELYDSGTGLTFPRMDSLQAVNAKGVVPTTTGAQPFYTTSANPSDSSCLSAMGPGDTCNVSWTVNATGNPGTYEFFTIAETDWASNTSSRFDVTITNNVPVLSSGAVSPDASYDSTLYNFTVTYTDVDNEAPSYVRVVINGTSYDMTAVDAGDTVYSDGKAYRYSTRLAAWNYSTYFTAKDWVNTTSTSVMSAPNVTVWVAPVSSENDGADSTDLSAFNETTIQNVVDFVWHKDGKGKIQWTESLDLSNGHIGGDDNIDNDIEVGDGFIAIDSSSAPAFADKSAVILLEDVDCDICNQYKIIYTSGFYSTLPEIRSNGMSCSLSGKCSDFTCSNPDGIGDCSFTVTGFSGYATGGDLNITLNDSAEGRSVEKNEGFTYYAYYVNATDGTPITGATCNVTDDDGLNPMTPDTGFYYYTKSAGFTSSGIKTWSVSCGKAGLTTLQTTDTIDVRGYGSDRNYYIVGANVTRINTSRLPETPAGNDSATAGNVTDFNLATNTSTAKWQGYYGQVAATVRLGNSDSEIMYDWGSVQNDQIKTVLASTDQSFNWGNFTSANATDVDTVYGWTASDTDSAVNTLDDGRKTIAQVVLVPIVNLTAYTSIGVLDMTIYSSGVFRDDGEIAAGNYDTLAYGVPVDPDEKAFDNETQVDYELIVPINTSGQAGTQTYYFFLDVQ